MAGGRCGFRLPDRRRPHPVDAQQGHGARPFRRSAARRRRRGPSLCHGVMVVRRRPRGRIRRSHARGPDQPSLWHDAVHRLGSDVLRRLVLGVLRRFAVHQRDDPIWARRVHRGRVAAQGHRGARSAQSAAAQHADPAHLRRDRHLGPSCAAGQRPPWPQDRPHADDPARPGLHQRAGVGIRARAVRVRQFDLRRDVLYGDGLPWRACDHRHDFPSRLPAARQRWPVHAPATLGLRVRRMVLALRRRRVVVPVLLHLRLGLLAVPIEGAAH